ncbi:MAG: hypothetical protein ACD_79C01101G0005 [uncultured bacterium]|nr:MAG: hypothetical protein ACD_79C01101G0005 [uncultured bacterium]
MNTKIKALVVAVSMMCMVAFAQDNTPKAQSLCPIDGNPISKDVSVDVIGVKVYACCAQCIEAIKADPSTAINTVIANGEQPEALDIPAPIAQ